MNTKLRLPDVQFLIEAFIVAAGLAALIHSTWTISTFFQGLEPVPQFSIAWWAWLIPGFLSAFAIDVGQIATSAAIKNGMRTRMVYVTFAAFCVITYYAQWNYLAVHTPVLPLSAAINPAVLPFANGLRDLGLWFIPALLPISTLLYSFAYPKPKRTAQVFSANKQTSSQTDAEPMRVELPPEQKQLPEPIAANRRDVRERVREYVREHPETNSYSINELHSELLANGFVVGRTLVADVKRENKV